MSNSEIPIVQPVDVPTLLLNAVDDLIFQASNLQLMIIDHDFVKLESLTVHENKVGQLKLMKAMMKTIKKCNNVLKKAEKKLIQLVRIPFS